MPPDLTTRPVTAPAADWLTEADVLKLLGDISSKTLARMIAAGRFPAGTPWGRETKWRWVDVAWFYLGKEIGERLKVAPDDEPE